MTTDKIAEIRARHHDGKPWFIARVAHEDRGYLLAEVERLIRERDKARAEVERLRAEQRSQRRAKEG